MISSVHNILRNLSSSDHSVLIALELQWKELMLQPDGAKNVAMTFVSSLPSSDHVEEFFRLCLVSLGNDQKNYLCQEILHKCGAEMLKEMAEDPSSALIKGVLNFLLMQLYEPYNNTSKCIVKSMLQACDLYVYDTIKMLLCDTLISGEVSEDFECQRHVYDVIYELLGTSRFLVTGLMNYCGMCLSDSRLDHFHGIEFLYELFIAKHFPGLQDPALVFRFLWGEFVSHFRDLKVIPLNKIRCLVRFTPQILQRQSLRADWCSLLLIILVRECRQDVEISIVDCILEALKPDLHTLVDFNSPSAVYELLRTLLDHHTAWKLSYSAWQHLYQGLGRLYRGVVKLSISGPLILKEHKNASAVLQLLLGICSRLESQNADWYMLQKVFTKYCICAENVESRFLMLFPVWFLSDSHRHVLQVLFWRARWACLNLKYLLNGVHLNNSKQTLAAANQFLSILPYQTVGVKFFNHTVVRAIKNSPEFKHVLTKLTSSQMQFKDTIDLIDQIRSMVVTKTWKEKMIWSSFCSLFTLNPCDQASFDVFLGSVNGCIYDDRVATIYDMDKLHLGQESLLLLQEMLRLSPHLGFTEKSVEYLSSWSEHSDSGISSFALRCLQIMINTSSVESRESWMNNHAEEFICNWFNKVENGGRHEAKMAIRCLSLHLSSFPEVETRVLKIITRQLSDASNKESFQRGVCALGVFASCFPSQERVVEDLAMSKVLNILAQDFKNFVESSRSSASDSLSTCSSQWCGWEHLPFCSSLLVGALRSLGRCIRYCGTEESAKPVLCCLEQIMSGTKFSSDDNLTKVEIDWLRLEAACAILNIMESSKFENLITLRLLGVFSSVMTDQRLEVRKKLSEKLCEGLKPHKLHASEHGKSKGHLSHTFLGFLPLLAMESYDCTDNADSIRMKKWAENLVTEVFLSRSLHAVDLCRFKVVTSTYLSNERSDLLSFYSLLYAIPILSAQPFVKSKDAVNKPVNFGSVTVSDVSIMQVAHCFAFIISIFNRRKSLFQVSREFLAKAIVLARGFLKRPENNILFKKYLAVWDVLNIVAEYYMPSGRCQYPKEIRASKVFYGSEHHDRVGFETQITSELNLRLRQRMDKFFSEACGVVLKAQESQTETKYFSSDSEEMETCSDSHSDQAVVSRSENEDSEKFYDCSEAQGRTAINSPSKSDETHGMRVDKSSLEGSSVSSDTPSISRKRFRPGAESTPLASYLDRPPKRSR